MSLICLACTHFPSSGIGAGVSVAVFFGKKWLKSGQIIKFTMGVIAILVLGIMSISILGMIDTIFDFRRVKNCELI